MKIWNRIAVFVAFGLAGCSGSGEKPAPEEHPHEEHAPEAGGSDSTAGSLRIPHDMMRDLRITTAPAEARTGGEGVAVLGELKVNEDAYAEVGSPIAARVMRVQAAPGDAVVAGQVLAELQSVELGKSRADYLAARARAELARAELERKQGLATDQIAPQREVQAAQAEASTAEAALQAARAALGALGISEKEIDAPGLDAGFLLRSPVAGVVLERDAVRGRMSDPARPLFRIADLSRLWLTVHASERDAVRIAAGTTARVEFPALPGRAFSGTVALVGREVEISSRTIPVRIDVVNDAGLLRPGMSATAWVPLGGQGETVVAVPAASLQRVSDGWCVFIPHGEDAFEVRHVGRGRDLGGYVEILSGLQPGETVVVDGAFLLKAEADKSHREVEGHAH
jgi:cobalt-zinc-cadmium efflux system membrane fusion protein